MSFLGAAVQELTGLGARDLTLAGIVTMGVTLIFLGWLVPYRLVRRSDYEATMDLLREAQATNATYAKALEAMAEKKDLATSVVEALRAEASNRGTLQEERT